MTVPPLALRATLLDRGRTDGDLRRMRRAGLIAPVRRGRYTVRPSDDPDSPEAQHLLLVRATVPQLAPGRVASHESAAVVLGLPVWNRPLHRVQVSRDGAGGGRITAGVHRHVTPLNPTETTVAHGLRVTDPARMVVDIACRAPFEESVVVADATPAPRTGHRAPPTDRGRSADALARCHRKGCTGARRVVAFADGGAHSPGESRSRVAMWRAGPPPVLQYEVLGPDGRSLGFADFGRPERRTLGEFDGRVKYGRLVAAGQVPADVLYDEKLREDAMRATDRGMVRRTWPDVDRFDAVAQQLRRTFRTPAHGADVRARPDMRA